MDQVLGTVPGVFAADRYNFSLDQRLSIRGAGARSSFGVRGIKILLDGVPQTLPDGLTELTNVDLGTAERVEVLRGPSSALYGNASGGVINIRTDTPPPDAVVEQWRVVAGTFSRSRLPLVGGTPDGTWTRWQSATRVRVGGGTAALTLSRFAYGGERQHSSADLRHLDAHYTTPLGGGLTLATTVGLGDDPRADNPGALTAAELARNPDSAAAVNLQQHAGKDVTQLQAAATLRRETASGAVAELALFGIARNLDNPQTFAWIRLHRRAYGARASVTYPLHPWGSRMRVTAGLDVEQQRDDRLNTGNQAGTPDTVRQLDQLERVTQVGTFVQLAAPLGRKTTATGGLRYDWTGFGVHDRLVTASNPDDSGWRLMRSPSGFLGATHTFSPAIELYANLGTSFETPTTTELANRPDTVGGFNPGLQPQHATSVELGVRGSLAGRVRYSVAAYRAGVRDELIPYQVPGSTGRVFYRNAGRSRHQGLELGADWTVLAGLSLTAAWTWTDLRYTSYVTGGHDLAGRAIPGVPSRLLHLLWRLRPPFTRGSWVEIEQTHASGVLVDDTLAARTSPWTTLDLRLGWDGAGLGGRLRPFLGINNVLDERYVGSVVINAARGRYYEPAPGRNGYAGLEVRLGR
jgi:iron complex outermembrane receptor protein